MILSTQIANFCSFVKLVLIPIACFTNFTAVTAPVALWLERPPLEREVVGSISGRDRPKSLKLVVVVFPPWRSGLWE